MTYDKTKEPYDRNGAEYSAQARNGVLVTPSNDNQLAVYAKALRVYVPEDVDGGVGQVTFVPVDAAADTDTLEFKFLPGNHDLQMGVRKVLATGTTAGLEIHAYFG